MTRAQKQFSALALLLAVVAGGLLVVMFSGHDRKPAEAEPVPAVVADPGTEAWAQLDWQLVEAVPSTPEDVDRLPEHAAFGYVPDPESSRAFLESLPGGKQTLSEQAPQLLAAGDGEARLLYRYLYLAYEQKHPGSKWVVGKQGIGDCVSWGWAHGVDIHLAILWRLGIAADWDQAATEAIYGGSRVEARGLDERGGGWSDGSYGSAAAKWVKQWGVVFRQDYRDRAGPETDLRTYSAGRAKQWGNYGAGGQGDNHRLDTIAREHPIKQVALVTTWAEAEAAIRNGYPIAVCSGQGFSSQRDRDGFSRPSGSWAHCMCFIAVRYDRPGLLCLNSWGPRWISGPRWPDDMPEGSFWVDRSVVERMLRGRDSFAIAGGTGFTPLRLKNEVGW